MNANDIDGDGDDDADDAEHGNLYARGPICENISQIPDMINPKPKLWRNPNQLLLQDTMESGPPEAPT